MLTTLFDFSDPSAANAWHAIDDRVMGGISRSSLRHDPAGHAVFEGQQAVQAQPSDTVKSTVRTPGASLDRVRRLGTLSPYPHTEIGLSWDARKHRGAILDHSHSIVAGGFPEMS